MKELAAKVAVSQFLAVKAERGHPRAPAHHDCKAPTFHLLGTLTKSTVDRPERFPSVIGLRTNNARLEACESHHESWKLSEVVPPKRWPFYEESSHELAARLQPQSLVLF